MRKEVKASGVSKGRNPFCGLRSASWCSLFDKFAEQGFQDASRRGLIVRVSSCRGELLATLLPKEKHQNADRDTVSCLEAA
jgi:hypothetical protein